MSDRWIVAKYGGTSVATPDAWTAIAERARRAGNSRRLIVVSALAGVSNALERAVEQARSGEGEGDDPPAWAEIVERHERFRRDANLPAEAWEPVARILSELRRLLQGARLSQEAPPRLRARILSFGELAASRLGAEVLRRDGLDVRLFDARERLTTGTDVHDDEESGYLDARVDWRTGVAEAPEGSLLLTQGFLARNEAGETCLLGRGGSDTSAALFAASWNAEVLEIWTDVDGMFTADPRAIPTARRIERLGYREAEELASMGARVLHPRCLGPVREAGVPVEVRDTARPDAGGTRIEAGRDDGPAVIAVVRGKDTVLLNVASRDMWRRAGFLARLFRPLEAEGISVDLLATSQSAVTCTLDRIPGGLDGPPMRRALDALEALGAVDVRRGCATVTIVGRRIRAALHELGPAFAAFREHPVHLMSQSAEDLNLSFVVDEGDAATLVQTLHDRLFAAERPDLGPTWERLHDDAEDDAPWWRAREDALRAAVADAASAYVYDLPTIRGQASALRRAVPSIDRWFYAQKANDHAQVLEAIVDEGFGLECVSLGELDRVRERFGAAVPLLFTPNGATVGEYAHALEAGAEVVVEGPEPLDAGPGTFAGVEVGLRVDPGSGHGHHEKVRTAGAGAKFGCAGEDLDRFRESAATHGVRVVGLHAHVGSGVFDPAAWTRTAAALLGDRGGFPDVRWIDLGGGLGVPERPGQRALDLAALEHALAGAKAAAPDLEWRMEPGRYLVAEAGVLVVRVRQVRRKGPVTYVSVSAGMNALLRPALYGAYHSIRPLSRRAGVERARVHVVGPICETGDVLGRDRWLPIPEPGDLWVVERAGAYGAVMANRYNRQPEPAQTALP